MDSPNVISSHLFQEALKLQLQSTYCNLNICSYFAQSQSEIETQEFNLSCRVPPRLLSDDDLAMWLLEGERLKRSNVCKLLSDLSSRGTLEKLAVKVCSLEIASAFVDGLKFFMPVVGCWEPDNDTESTTVKYFLKVYVKAHLQCSSTPIFTTGFENIPVIVDVALCVLSLCRTLQTNKKSQALLMSDFFAALRTILRQGDGLNLSMKGMTDLFVASSSGRPMSALEMPLTLPSYLFCNVKKSGYISLGFKLDDNFRTYYARLCHDALYLFDINCGDISHQGNLIHSTSPQSMSTVNLPRKLLYCIPLNSAHFQFTDEDVSLISSECSSAIMECVSVDERKLPVIEYNTTEYYDSLLKYYAQNNRQNNYSTQPVTTTGNSTSATDLSTTILFTVYPKTSSSVVWPGPKSVSYHDTIFITLINGPTTTDYPADQNELVSDLYNQSIEWLDALENSCWDSRAKLHYTSTTKLQ